MNMSSASGVCAPSRGDVAQYAHGQTRTREGVTVDETLHHTQLTAYAAHLVLEEETQWLTQFEVHLLGETTHIVVALDDRTGDGRATR